MDDISLGPAFFDRNIHDVAKDLLGRHLVRAAGGVKAGGRIVEVEVYEGANDGASHARRGEPTERTAPMFGEPGTIYVYTIYGMYECLNFRAPSTVGPGAILIRSCQPLAARAVMARRRGLIEALEDYGACLEDKLMSGPAKICQALAIERSLSGAMIGDKLWVSAGRAIWQNEPARVQATPRKGLNRKTCGDCVDRPWRYVVGD